MYFVCGIDVSYVNVLSVIQLAFLLLMMVCSVVRAQELAPLTLVPGFLSLNKT